MSNIAFCADLVRS